MCAVVRLEKLAMVRLTTHGRPPNGVCRGIVRRRGRAHLDGGFSYLGLLFVLALMAVGCAALGEVWKTLATRAREDELLYVGHQFRVAICHYYENKEVNLKRFPTSLDALLVDERSSRMVRHLRQIYADPVTGKPEWGFLKAPDGGIQGVFSLSESEPLKARNFAPPNQQFEGAKRHMDWVFAYLPQVTAVGMRPCDFNVRKGTNTAP